jgi:hypothetical protein
MVKFPNSEQCLLRGEGLMPSLSYKQYRKERKKWAAEFSSGYSVFPFRSSCCWRCARTADTQLNGEMKWNKHWSSAPIIRAREARLPGPQSSPERSLRHRSR